MNKDMQKRGDGYDYYYLYGNVDFQGLFPETETSISSCGWQLIDSKQRMTVHGNDIQTKVIHYEWLSSR